VFVNAVVDILNEKAGGNIPIHYGSGVGIEEEYHAGSETAMRHFRR